jgi:hypothetical protein
VAAPVLVESPSEIPSRSRTAGHGVQVPLRTVAGATAGKDADRGVPTTAVCRAAISLSWTYSFHVKLPVGIQLGRASAGRATPATGAVQCVGRSESAPCEMGAAEESLFHVKRMPRWRAASAATLGQLVETEGAGGGGVKGMAPQIRDLSVRQPRLPHRARRPSSWRRCSPLPDPFDGLFHVKPDSGVGRAGGASFGPLSDLAPPKLIASRWPGPNTDEEWIRSL